ncbi:ABC transporter permease [Mesomycoplasma lagogenitalium]|uniref:ABC transporter permease n=1 Tax=Mesomycoplasma lagogenitalium TaxID=171286 RepID=A0ABY8LUU1_9BACT|nr:ABC transporter permease [Mesomycoplasma lagogenitalium]WGI36996.1 ABC transporter permease [Mesomycoplasma lagogenitalium]
MSKIIEFFKKNEIIRKSYIWIILIIFYIPIFFGLVYSFNKPSDKDLISTTWNTFSWKGYEDLKTQGKLLALANSFIIAISTSIIVIIISLITVFALWKQKNKSVKSYVNSTSNIPLINPDIITAISLAILLTTLFGVLRATDEGMIRAIVSHVTMTLPYGIMLMFPRSEKFSKNLFEASQDLGYGKIKTWFKIYLTYMIPAIVFVFVIVTFLSFDDFIITRITSNTSTIGVELYQGTFKTWALALGAIMLVVTIVGNIAYISYKTYRSKKGVKNGNV